MPSPQWVELVRGSITDRDVVREAMVDVTHVLHLATCKETPEQIMDVTVKGLFWLLEECRVLRGCPTGEVKITGGHNLTARHVIHTVGPIWNGGDAGEDDLLRGCYQNSMAIATASGLRTIAFPAISTGVYRFSIPRATQIAVATVADALRGRCYQRLC